MFGQVEEQLQHLYSTVGDVPVLIVASKADLAASSEELAEKVAALKGMVGTWVESMRAVQRRVDEREE